MLDNPVPESTFSVHARQQHQWVTGSAGTFVNLILQAYPGSTAEAIVYPAQGGTNAAYASSVQNGTKSIASQINAFNKKCPNARLVVVGYSQV